MSLLWLAIPVVIALPLFLLTMFVSVTATNIKLNLKRAVPTRVSVRANERKTHRD